MRRTSLFLLAPLLLLAVPACPHNGPAGTSVPFPPKPSSPLDSTKPALWIQATSLTATHTTTAAEHVPGTAFTPVQGGLLDMSHTVPNGDAGSPAFDERSLIVSYRATDPESGIQRVRLLGTVNACDANGVLVDYRGANVYDSRDFTIGGATTIPVVASNTVTISLFELLHPYKDAADHSKGRKDGTSGTFKFFVETSTASGVFINSSEALIYGVGNPSSCPAAP
jgi:hypothetical protein